VMLPPSSLSHTRLVVVDSAVYAVI
jgi:hypothetical protein